MISTIGAVAAGGAIGAVMRHGVNSATLQLWGDAFPYGTLIVNVVGSFLLGAIVTLFDHVWTPSDMMRAFAVTGVLSAFTTFSTFSLDAIQLLERQQYLAMSIYYLGSVALSVLSIIIAIHLVKAFIS